MGALTAKFAWQEPEEEKKNGEVVAYQLIINSFDWLAPREITVSNSLNYTFTGKCAPFPSVFVSYEWSLVLPLKCAFRLQRGTFC